MAADAEGLTEGFPGYGDHYTGPVVDNTPEMRAAIGVLMQDLNLPGDERHDGSPVPAEWMQMYQDHATLAQLVAIRGGEVVGAANASITMESYAGPEVFLGAMVVREDHQGVRDSDGHTVFGDLMDQFFAFGRQFGAENAHMGTEPEFRGRALSAYKRLGGVVSEHTVLINMPVPAAAEA